MPNGSLRKRNLAEVLAKARQLRVASRRLVGSCESLRHSNRFSRRKVLRLQERSADLLTVSLFQRSSLCLPGKPSQDAANARPELRLLA